MARPEPIRIFLVRHGLSEANMDKRVNARKPDHAIELSDEGRRQAVKAGYELAKAVLGDASGQRRRLRLLVSPYLRTRQTADGLEEGLRAASLVFDRREVSELREISFGLYDGLSDDELAEQMPREHAHYEKHVRFEGEYFAPMPMGESRIQVGDRVKAGVFGTILRDATPRGDLTFAEEKGAIENGVGPITDFVVVSHGVTIRQFIHRWMHHPWEWAEREPNPGNCAIRLIEGAGGSGYVERTVFPGFRHVRADHARQEKREEGAVKDAAPAPTGGRRTLALLGGALALGFAARRLLADASDR